MLRRAILSTIFSVALAVPALAADPLVYAPAPSGHPFYAPPSMIDADLTLGGGFLGDNLGVAGGARANMDFGNSWNLTVDLNGNSGGGFGGYGHFFKRHAGGAVGVFAGAAGANCCGLVTVGVEGSLNVTPNVVVGGDVAWNKQPQGTSWTSAGVNAAYYFSPQTKIGGDLFWAGGSPTGGATTGGSVVLAHQFMDNIVAFGRLGFRNASPTNYFGLIGATLYLGRSGQSMQEHDMRLPFGRDLIYYFK